MPQQLSLMGGLQSAQKRASVPKRIAPVATQTVEVPAKPGTTNHLKLSPDERCRVCGQAVAQPVQSTYRYLGIGCFIVLESGSYLRLKRVGHGVAMAFPPEWERGRMMSSWIGLESDLFLVYLWNPPLLWVDFSCKF